MDTYTFITTLKSTGFTEAQAIAIVDGCKNASMDHVATKEDIRAVRLEISDIKVGIQHEMSTMKAEIQHEIYTIKGEIRQEIINIESCIELKIANVKFDMLKWLFPMMMGQAALIAALVKLL